MLAHGPSLPPVLVRVRRQAAPPGPAYEITRKLFSSWISLAYIALAQLGVPHPLASHRLGWAWAGLGEVTEALALNDFALNALRSMAGAEPRTAPQPPPGPPSDAAPAGEESSGRPVGTLGVAGSVGGGSEEAAEGEVPGGEGGGRLARDRVAMVRLEDAAIGTTSTAFRVFSQQVGRALWMGCRLSRAERCVGLLCTIGPTCSKLLYYTYCIAIDGPCPRIAAQPRRWS